jgi:catechol 2,3-dioxygenase-like lactoylglutathione lyase family enzyme
MRPHAFVLAVPDFDRSVRYFVDILGFRPEWRDGANWQSLIRGGVRVMLGHCPDALPPREIGDHSYFAYIIVDDVDALHAELLGKGAVILHAPVDQPWSRREMTMATPDGHRIMFAETTTHR